MKKTKINEMIITYITIFCYRKKKNNFVFGYIRFFLLLLDIRVTRESAKELSTALERDETGAGPSASRCVSLFYRFLSRPSFHSFLSLSLSLSLPFSLFPCVSPFLHCNGATGVAPPNQYRTTHPRKKYTQKNLIFFFLRTQYFNLYIVCENREIIF
jgi:hypothetical protein